MILCRSRGILGTAAFFSTASSRSSHFLSRNTTQFFHSLATKPSSQAIALHAPASEAQSARAAILYPGETTPRTLYTWVEYLEPYTRSHGIYHCPDAGTTDNVLGAGAVYIADYALMPGRPGYGGGTGARGTLGAGGGQGTQDCPFSQYPSSTISGSIVIQNFQLSQVVRPTESMLFTEGYLGHQPSNGNFLERFFFARHNISSSAPGAGSQIRTAMDASGCPGYAANPAAVDPRFRPDSGMNVGFVDGHAKYMKRGQHQEKIQLADGTWIWRYLTADM